jgi:predicted GIY-YIG superfamily endonuclease
MVHWVYVLECEDDYIYVGETTRLFRRFKEHLRNRGGSNTIKHKPYKLIGLYKVNENYSFMKYRNTIKSGEYNRFILDDWENDGDNLLIENHITERFLYERRENKIYGCGAEWYKVRGGKYTRETLDETVASYKLASEKKGRHFNSSNPINFIPIDTIVDRPLCKCDCPSEVKLSKDKTKIYFVCALKNVWGDFWSDLQVNTPCDFWQLYTDDKDVKKQHEVVKARSKENWISNIPLSIYKIHPEPCISCSKTEYLAIFNDGTRRLCQQCILKNYDLLKEKYDTKCIISGIHPIKII